MVGFLDCHDDEDDDVDGLPSASLCEGGDGMIFGSESGEVDGAAPSSLEADSEL